MCAARTVELAELIVTEHNATVDEDRCACGGELKPCDGCGASICPGCDDEALCVREAK